MRTFLVWSLCSSSLLAAQQTVSPGEVDPRVPLFQLPPIGELAAGGMRDPIERYQTDRRTLQRFFDVDFSSTRSARLEELARTWRTGLDTIDFDALDQDGRIDWLLLANQLDAELAGFAVERERREETQPLVPFAETIIALQERRRRLGPLDPAAAAEQLEDLRDAIAAVQREALAGLEPDAGPDALLADPVVANRAAGVVLELRDTLEEWFEYYDGYDPLFSWWMREPHARVDETLEEYARVLREDVAGIDEDDEETILGDPIGRQALVLELERELIPYTPEELVEIAELELGWCDAQMLRAAGELGFGDDWRAAQEHVKSLYAEPGGQTETIRMLAFEAIDFLEGRELLTIPALAKNSWRMEMMSPERQRYTPYFTGGEVISVSYPTEDMAHADKLMSMRGNNLHFSRAVVHHELIPGHHLQQYMRARHKPYRRVFSTPFWGEGWALYWEMLLWDEGFARSPEDRIGMLFWRKHRCARILFSLSFQLGDWSPERCIDFLVERVGHERRNAAAEVRRSVQGGYGPLYQAAYMLGGLQFRALHLELVRSGEMSNRDFHDSVLRENAIPVELVRARLIDQELTPDFRSGWRFYEGLRVR